MTQRRADVFFYGLFMDEGLLRSKGLQPTNVELASLLGMTLRIGERATLVPDAAGRVHGVVMTLTLDELERLYSDSGVQSYRPQAVLVHPQSGGTLAALCYNLPDPPAPGARNADYAQKLRVLGERVGLPPEYVASIK
jgi:Gamma-glutamyl cyclotransferase, AIG2-like